MILARKFLSGWPSMVECLRLQNYMFGAMVKTTITSIAATMVPNA
jgi:hypothetical protein